jgi:hypothetical protein
MNDKLKQIGAGAFAEICELLKAGDQDATRDSALSVEVRSCWTTPGAPMEADEYMILITTGGPAVRVTGALGRYGAPASAWLEVQDWGTPWERYLPADAETLLDYASHFYFGE